MGNAAKQILEKALGLSATERSALIESLLASLDQPDPAIDTRWAEKAEARIDAVDRGEMETVSADDVFAKYGDS